MKDAISLSYYYVDDMLIVKKDKIIINKLKEELNKAFVMNNLGPTMNIWGMQIIHDRKRKKLWLSQK